MTPEAAISSTPDVNSANSSPAPDITASPSSADVNPQAVQGESQTPQGQQPEDILAGFPSDDDLKAAVANKTPYAEQAARIKSAYDDINPKYKELQTKYQAVEPYQSHLERFEKPEQLQQIVEFRDKLYGWEKDPVSGQLVPATQSLAQELSQTAPQRADFLSSDLLNGMTTDGGRLAQPVSRMDLALEAIAEDPVRRAAAAKILGLVEQTSIAPTWEATQEELENVKPELQGIYKKLPYDQRQRMLGSDPDFINEHLESQRIIAEATARDQRQQVRDQQMAVQRDEYIKTQSEAAGNQLVEQRFVEGFTGFANNICEKFQPIAPIDPQSPEAQQMGPEQVTATNAKIQKINRGAGLIVSLVTAASAVPDTAFLVKQIANEIGIPAEVLGKFDEARQEFASNNRNFGQLRKRAEFGQNGNGNGLPQDIGMLQTNAQAAERRLIANGKAVAEGVMTLLTEFFSLQATSHNQTLNGGAQARPAITGSAYDPTQAPQQRPHPTSEAEIRQRMQQDAARLAAR